MEVKSIAVTIEMIVVDPNDKFRNTKPRIEVVGHLAPGENLKEAFTALRLDAFGMLKRLEADSLTLLTTGAIPQPAPAAQPAVAQAPTQTGILAVPTAAPAAPPQHETPPLESYSDEPLFAADDYASIFQS